MRTIKEIKLSDGIFHIITDNIPLKLNYKEENKKIIVDINQYNLLDATKIAILCSTFCFIKGFEKKICWLVKDEEIKKAINILKLMNTETQTANEIIEKRILLAS